MPCRQCGNAVVQYADNGEWACGDDPSHDIDGSEADDDELNEPDPPSQDEEDYDPENPSTWDPASAPWTVTDDSEAEWALAKLQRAKSEVRNIERRAQAEVDRISAWHERTARGPLRDVEFFTGHLRRYYEKVVVAGGLYGKSKSYNLTNGTLSTRAGSEKVEVVDEAACLDFAEGNGRVELLNIKTTPNKPAIKKALKAGEQIPGVELVRSDDSFSVEVSTEEAPAWIKMPEAGAA